MEGYRFSVFENRQLRRLFGPYSDKVTGGYRKLNDEELHNLCTSTIILRMTKSRRLRWIEYVARIERKLNKCRILMGKPERKKSLERTLQRYVSNIVI
jgi:hypothetical protein